MSRQVTLNGGITRTTERAVLLAENEDTEHWIPRSVCLDGDTLEVGDTGVVVALWYAEQEGLA